MRRRIVFDGPPPAPRVRLMRGTMASFRIIEVLRLMASTKNGVMRIDGTRGSPEPFIELGRRGALDPLTHFVSTMGGSIGPTASAQHAVAASVRAALDLGLAEPYCADEEGPGSRRYRKMYQVTKAGLETLADWDSTISEGLFPSRGGD